MDKAGSKRALRSTAPLSSLCLLSKMLCHLSDQAYLALADYFECETDIKRALVEDPKNVGVRLLQKEYKQKVGLATLLRAEGCCLTLGVGITAVVAQLPPTQPARHETMAQTHQVSQGQGCIC